VLVAKAGARKLLALGLVGGSFTLYWLGELNLSAGYWDIFWPQFIQGISLGLLFVPLTTITMDAISREKMGNATSIFNLMRNLGGSMGIAASTTLLARHGQAFTNTLAAHVTPYDPAARSMLEGLRQMFMARGADVVTATQRANAAVFGLVSRQATMLAFVSVFRLLALIFLLMLPLVLIMRSPRARGPVTGAH